MLIIGAGTGGVYLLRWYWWRINAWSEIAAMATAIVVTVITRWVVPFKDSGPVLFAKTALTTTIATTVVWVIVTFLTRPEPEAVLVKFYRQVRPWLGGWKPVARLAAEVPPTQDLGRNLVSWVLGCTMVYLALFGSGYLLMGAQFKGVVSLVVAAICAGALYSNLSRTGWQSEKSA